MAGIFAFFSSILALGSAGAMAFKDQSDIDKSNAEYIKNRYSYAVQSRYERDCGDFNLDKVIEAIKLDYPSMNDYCAYQVALTAIAKRRMEEETNYRYNVPENCKYFNLEKYTTNEFREKT